MAAEAGPGEVERDTLTMVVDDEEDIRDSLKDLLEDEFPKLDVETYGDGKSALQRVREKKPRLMVVDYKMPGMDGMELLGEVDELPTGINRPHAPPPARILITAYADVDLARRAINEELADRFLTKPLDPEELTGTVQDLLYETSGR